MSTPLLEAFLGLLAQVREVCPQQRTDQRLRRHMLGLVLTVGRATITSVLDALGRKGLHWDAEFRLFNRCQWQVQDCFATVLRQGLALKEMAAGPVLLAGDFTHIRRQGPKVETAQVMVDPLGPKGYHRNLIRGFHMLQVGLCVAATAGYRFLPVACEPVPRLRKPGKRATAEQLEQWRQAQRQRPTMTATRACLVALRANLDAVVGAARRALIALDGSFANQTMLREPIAGLDLVVRIRRDASLRLPAAEPTGRRFYASEILKAEAVRINHELYPARPINIMRKGHPMSLRIKEISLIYYPGVAARRPLRLLVVSTAPRKGRAHDPGFEDHASYLITTDLLSPAETIIEVAFARWEIEVAHREEKTILGMGQAQVRKAQAVQRHPALVVVTYAMIHLAALQTNALEQLPALPKWRNKGRSRPSLNDLLRLLRHQATHSHDLLVPFGLKPSSEDLLQACAA